jgi:hypothetical protein
MSIEEVVGLANKYIAEGSSVELHATIFHSLVLRVFRGSQYLGGYWENVAKTENDKFFGTIKSRKYKCNRKFVINEDNSIGLTPCVGECIAEIRSGEFVDYTKICNMRD